MVRVVVFWFVVDWRPSRDRCPDGGSYVVTDDAVIPAVVVWGGRERPVLLEHPAVFIVLEEREPSLRQLFDTAASPVHLFPGEMLIGCCGEKRLEVVTRLEEVSLRCLG